MSYQYRMLNTYNHFLTGLGKMHLTPDSPFLEIPSLFPELNCLKENYTLIRRELAANLDDQAPSMRDLGFYGGNQDNKLPWNKELIFNSIEPDWRIKFLKMAGRWTKRNAEHFPETIRLLKQCPNVASAFFSCLGPNSTIEPHYGYYKGVLRYHLGIIIPDSEKCGLMVDGIEYHWQEGEAVLFDDMYEHSAYNHSDKTRVVLFLDLYRPLPVLIKQFNRFIYEKAATVSKEGKQAWEVAEA